MRNCACAPKKKLWRSHRPCQQKWQNATTYTGLEWHLKPGEGARSLGCLAPLGLAALVRHTRLRLAAAAAGLIRDLLLDWRLAALAAGGGGALLSDPGGGSG